MKERGKLLLRIGTKRISEILHCITEPVNLKQLKDLYSTGGPEKMSYLEKLQEIGTAMKEASKCGLGQAAPAPLLSSLEFFKNEYCTLIQHRQREYERFIEEIGKIQALAYWKSKKTESSV